MKDILKQKAIEAMQKAYSPYSNFKVGAALLTADGEIYTGCNIENASFSPTICAERAAISKAVSEGKRGFSAIAICGGKSGVLTSEECFPCGVCRQVLAEFCGKDFSVFIVTKNDIKEYKLCELLPYSFGLEV